MRIRDPKTTALIFASGKMFVLERRVNNSLNWQPGRSEGEMRHTLPSRTYILCLLNSGKINNDLDPGRFVKKEQRSSGLAVKFVEL
ncbi:unnamed protein product [Sphenostylis stenocarpa]|uniref:Uncharacterized protein n=1 Tax=Sphenostylis stenocarpa TaxID=92480 RepID=A0AA86V5P8_9FABA|nr:unnamed protein product [Sphenostylis stenocarpa]